MRWYFVHSAIIVAFLCSSHSRVQAQAHPLAPAFNSNPGAPYTVYLDFSGFAYTGDWGGQTPGTEPAYNGQTGSTFTAAEQANIKSIWTRISEQYSPFNVNVTTVDPAVLAGQNANDSTRQTYYDNTARLIHTVIGDGASTFFGNAGGVSYVDVISSPQTDGMHTNWAFTNRLGGSGALHNIGTASSHEDGHSFGLWHQADYIGSVIQGNGYSTNNNSSLLAPTMGVSYGAARPAWRSGDADINGTKGTQNDPLAILTSNSGIGNFVEDGIGHTRPTASSLPLAGNSIIFNLAKGIIVPASSFAPNPMGESNYTTDFFSFTTTGGLNTINLVAGREAITPGVADPDPMLDGTLRILDSSGNVVGLANTASLGETLSLNLAAGNYFIEVSSAGGKAADTNGGVWDPASYYDMGSYFLTGTIVAVPEPATIALFGVAIMAAGYGGWRYRQKRKTALEQLVEEAP